MRDINLPIVQAIQDYLQIVATSRSAHTMRSYKNGLNLFIEILKDNDLDPSATPARELTEDGVIWFIDALRYLAPASERLYLTAVSGFYEYLVAESIAEINPSRIKMIIQQRARRPGIRLPQFPRKEIDGVIQFAESLKEFATTEANEHLRNLRDRAFIITLADTGLRVHEACNLRRGDVDWDEQKAVIIGKGDRQAVVRFSMRSVQALKDYLAARRELDGNTGRTLSSLPLFSRHDKGSGKKIKPITTTTGRNIICERVRQALGEEAVGRITPHSFRHYFVTVVLRGSGGNLKLAQTLARHKNIAVTQRYAHLSDDEIDQSYDEIFNN